MENTPKTVAMQLGAFVTLFVSIGAFLTLLFGIINLAFPDAADSFWQYEHAQDGIRYSIALLVVFFPAYLFLTRKVNVARRTESGLYHTLTKWFVYLALLVGGLVILGDLVAVILTFLNGEITTRFILKALSILIVVGAAFQYYLLDAKGYWNSRERKSLEIGLVTLFLVIAAVVYGYMQIDAPSQVRDMRLDQEQVRDLQDIQWRVEEHYAKNESFPLTLEQLYKGLDLPSAPEDRPAYEYKIVDTTKYELCATFETQSQRNITTAPIAAIPEKGYDPANHNWEHGVGAKCFERSVTAATKE